MRTTIETASSSSRLSSSAKEKGSARWRGSASTSARGRARPRAAAAATGTAAAAATAGQRHRHRRNLSRAFRRCRRRYRTSAGCPADFAAGYQGGRRPTLAAHDRRRGARCLACIHRHPPMYAARLQLGCAGQRNRAGCNAAEGTHGDCGGQLVAPGCAAGPLARWRSAHPAQPAATAAAAAAVQGRPLAAAAAPHRCVPPAAAGVAALHLVAAAAAGAFRPPLQMEKLKVWPQRRAAAQRLATQMRHAASAAPATEGWPWRLWPRPRPLQRQQRPARGRRRPRGLRQARR